MKKFISLFLGLSIATCAFTPMVKANTSDKIIHGIKVGSFIAAGVVSSYKTLQYLTDTTNIMFNPDLDNMIRNHLNQDGENTLRNRLLIKLIIASISASIAYLYLYGFVTYMMFKNLKEII